MPNVQLELKPNRNIPTLAPGYTVKVHVKVVEGERVRTQVFQGVVIKVRGGGINSSFTVRRIASGVGVERVFPIYSPLVEKVEVIRVGKVRRARLFYLRGLSGRAARIKEKRAELAEAIGIPEEVPEEAMMPEETAPPAEAPAPTAEKPVPPPVETVATPEDKPAAQETAKLEEKAEAKKEPEPPPETTEKSS